jgi:choice-of-anchor B domain-containing protein
VVSYNGPDTEYLGSEILIGANESRVVIVNVTDKDQPENISGIQYGNIGYTHQGWFTEDQRYFILGDEMDEINFGLNSRTLVFDLSDLDDPVLFTTYLGPTTAIDHNGYVKGNEFFLANYSAGVRILNIANIAAKTITETGFFDTLPANDTPSFDGVWGVYPYFDSGKIIASDISSGLFVIKKSN